MEKLQPKNKINTLPVISVNEAAIIINQSGASFSGRIREHLKAFIHCRCRWSHTFIAYTRVSWEMKHLLCISKKNCVKLIVLVEEGYCGRQIGERLHSNQSTVARILRKWKDTESTNDLPRTGRPQKTSPHQDGTTELSAGYLIWKTAYSVALSTQTVQNIGRFINRHCQPTRVLFRKQKLIFHLRLTSYINK